MAQLDNFFANHIDIILEVIFITIGLQLFYTAYRILQDPTNKTRIGSALFWAILSITFIFGPYLPNIVNGIFVVILALLTLFKQVSVGSLAGSSEEVQEKRSEKFGNKIFIPVILLGVTALIVSMLFPSLSSAVVGFGALVSLIAIIVLVKPQANQVLEESDRMVQQVSTVGILPQLLAAIGGIFTAAGVGDVIASLITNIMPSDALLWGVIAYVLGMVIFTMIMGNAFAAFSVITVGIGMPFVIEAGADPAIAAALAMTAGFCGTLMTPMAGNFNALPAALLETKSEYSVIKEQVVFALVMIVVHIVLMYLWAF